MTKTENVIFRFTSLSMFAAEAKQIDPIQIWQMICGKKLSI